MLREITIAAERWPLRQPFRIARGIKTEAEVVVVSLRQGDAIGRGESCPTARYGESLDSVVQQIEAIAPLIEQGMTRADLQSAMPPGAARCAVDCALWDLEAAKDQPHDPSLDLVSAYSIGIDTPERMAAIARGLADARLIKVKLDGTDCEARLRAIRAKAPNALMTVDANEGWSLDLLAALQPLLADLRIAFVEQPLPAGSDAALAGFQRLVPLCADESCHVTSDLATLVGRYDMINIKLDKTGGLTEALHLQTEARRLGLGVMIGCMVGTSLSMAPALHIAHRADFADLDGPWLLAEDRPGGIGFTPDGGITLPNANFWGPPIGRL